MSRVPQKHVFKDPCRCHTKQMIRGWGPCLSFFFWYETNYIMPILLLLWHWLQICNLQPSQTKMSQTVKFYILNSRCHTKRRIGGAPSANPSFGITTTKLFKDTLLQHTSHSEESRSIWVIIQPLEVAMYWNLRPICWFTKAIFRNQLRHFHKLQEHKF